MITENERVVLNAVRPWHCLKDPDVELPALIRATEGARSFLEIGTFKGATAAALALAHTNMAITTIDLPDPSLSHNNPQAKHQCGEAIRALGLERRIEQVRMDSAALCDWCGLRRFDVIFVDGDHRTAAVLRDLGNAQKLLSPGGLIICHDYTDEGDRDRPHWTVEVYEAVRIFLNLNNTFKAERMPGWLVGLYENAEAVR